MAWPLAIHAQQMGRVKSLHLPHLKMTGHFVFVIHFSRVYNKEKVHFKNISK
jgi:hypothetical protein